MINRLPLLILPFGAWLLFSMPETVQEDFSSEKVNLALRRTADGLLRNAGDSTSLIPAIEQIKSNSWQVRLDTPFNYDQLPSLLQSSFDLYHIKRRYNVAVRRCSDATIDLGYHQLDLYDNKVPCKGREMPEGCHYLEITFTEKDDEKWFNAKNSGILLLLLSSFIGFWFFRRQKKETIQLTKADEIDWLEFGNSRLDIAGQVLLCNGQRQTLTFRETKLLRLFINNADQILERDFILKNIWEDEGILVGRSVDVFVSRLRKKLADDTAVAFVAVHGVGYRLEVKKLS
jgi:hypothetical protein